MNFDIKDVKSWATRKDVKVGDEGYFVDFFCNFKRDDRIYKGTISEIEDDVGQCFHSERGYKWFFFLPLSAVKEDKPKEKKYRSLKSIDEIDCLFDCSVMSAKNFITYRSKITGEIYIELLFAVCRDKNDVLISINNIPVQDLFDNFEIRKNGEWLPFGIEVNDEQ